MPLLVSWPCGTIVTDLYRFRPCIYNCMKAKYRIDLQNPFSFAAPCILARRFSLSYQWSVTALHSIHSSLHLLINRHDGVLGPPNSSRFFLFSYF